MAKEWYLMTSPYDQLSGFESEALDDFAEEGFLEALDSNLADDVNICNADLSEINTIRAIIQNNVQDTKLKSLSRMMLTQIGTCKAGMYVEYDNRYWIIVSIVDDNKVYEKSILSICNAQLTWQNANGDILQRWANVINASQYNNGEEMTRNYTIRADQLLVSIPDDKDSLEIVSGQRFIIDKRCKLYEKSFDSNVSKDTNNPVLTYKTTRVNNVIYDYQDSGVVELMLYQDEQHDDDGYYVINGNGYWLCGSDIQEISEDQNDDPILLSEIIADDCDLYNGLDPVRFLAKFYDENGNDIEVEYSWNIDCDFKDRLEITYEDNSICISVNDKKLINKSFNLLLSADGYETVSKTITIKAFI